MSIEWEEVQLVPEEGLNTGCDLAVENGWLEVGMA